MSPFKAGVIALVVIGVVVFFTFTKANPFASPYKLTAVFRYGQQHQAQLARADRRRERGQGHQRHRHPRRPGRGEGDDGDRQAGAADPPGRDAQDPAAHLPRGQRVRGPAAGLARVAGDQEGLALRRSRSSRPPRRCSSTRCSPRSSRTPARTSRTSSRSTRRASPTAAPGLQPGREVDARRLPLRLARQRGHARLRSRTTSPRWSRGQAKVFRALDVHEQDLKDLITNFNTTAAAFAREDQPLQQAIPALDTALKVGTPALQRLNGALPALRSFSRTALPAAKSSGPDDRRLDAVRDPGAPAREPVGAEGPDARPDGHDPAARQAQPRLDPAARGDAPAQRVPEQRAAAVRHHEDPGSGLPEELGLLLPAGVAHASGPGGREPDQRRQLGHVPHRGRRRPAHGRSRPTARARRSSASRPSRSRPRGPAKPDSRPVDRPNVPCETQQPPDLHAPTQLASTPD